MARLALHLLALVVLAGGCSRSPAMPRERATFAVSLAYAGASPEVIEREIVLPVEAALAGVRGARVREARIVEGHALVTVEVTGPGTGEAVLRDVRAALAALQPQLPPQLDAPRIARGTPPPALWLEVRGEQPAAALSGLADELVRARLERVPGVAEIELHGLVEGVIAIRPDLARLTALDLTLAELETALVSEVGRAGAIGAPAGVRVDAGIRDVNELAAIVIREREGALLRVGDVATVEETTTPRGAAATPPGGPRLGVRVQARVPAGRVLAAVRAELAAVRAELPAGVALTETTAPASAPRPPAPLTVWIHGPELAVLEDHVEILARALAAAGIGDVVREPGAGEPEHRLDLDRPRLAEAGVSAAAAAQAIHALVAGAEVGTLAAGGRERAIVLRGTPTELPAALAALHVRTRTGALVPLASLARVTLAETRPIVRRDRERAAGLAIYAAGSALEVARKLVAAQLRDLPAGYRAARVP